MVQGSFSYEYSLSSKMSDQNWEKASKRSGFEAMQKREQEKKEKDKEQDKKYGAWGSTFKNKEHFTNMHHC